MDPLHMVVYAVILAQWYQISHMIDRLFNVLCPTREYLTQSYEEVTIAGEGLQIYACALSLCTRGLWAGRDLYRATPAVTRGLGFCCLIQRTTPYSCLLRYVRGCWGSILNLDPHRSHMQHVRYAINTNNNKMKWKISHQLNEFILSNSFHLSKAQCVFNKLQLIIF